LVRGDRVSRRVSGSPNRPVFGSPSRRVSGSAGHNPVLDSPVLGSPSGQMGGGLALVAHLPRPVRAMAIR
jgi:hypothetical protein